MTERERLSRIFGIEPLRPMVPLAVSAALGVIPPALIVSGIIVVTLAAMYVDDNRKIRKALDEVKTWDYPVEGYREWLLAREPAFDLELRRDVGVELIEQALAAIDSAIEVERRGERVVRVIMRRVEVRSGEHVPTFLAGDRIRLAEVRDRVLAPLHADVGIVVMRMGNRESLGALVAAASNTEGAFREQAKVAPPDLQSLVHVGTSQLAPPREARSRTVRIERLLYAQGQRPSGAAAMAGALGILTLFGAAVAPLGILAGAGCGALAAYAMRLGDRGRAYAELAKAARWPFPVLGYDDWLLSGRPICDLEFGSPPKRTEVERALRGVARVAALTWLSDTLLRMESQPILHNAGEGILPFWGGDPRELQQVARRVLVPLHETHRIVAVRMGGYLDRRV